MRSRFLPTVPSWLILGPVVVAVAVGFATRTSAQQGTATGSLQAVHVQGNVYLIPGEGESGNVTLQVEGSSPRPQRPPGIFTGEYGVLLVDTGSAAQSERIRSAIRQVSNAPVRFILSTHVHPDHTGGNANLAVPPGGRGAAAAIVAHEAVLDQMSGSPESPQAAWPTDAFPDYKELWFNGESIQMFHEKAAHSDGDVIVYFRRSDVVSTGDIFVPTRYPVIDLTRGGTVQGVIDGLNHVLDLAIPEDYAEGGTRIIPGHGRICDEADVVEYRNMIVIVRDRVQNLINRGMTLEQVKAARPSLDYDYLYGSDTGPWTTSMFIEAIYRELSASKRSGT
jgi:glyoxylase-like metal-dependent hydrolase (beta-lactamase superfamily II)